MKKLISINYGFDSIRIPAYIQKGWAVHRHLGIKKNWAPHRHLQDGLWVVTHVPSGTRLPHFFPNKSSAFLAAKLARRIFSNLAERDFYLIADRWFDGMAAARFELNHNPPIWISKGAA